MQQPQSKRCAVLAVPHQSCTEQQVLALEIEPGEPGGLLRTEELPAAPRSAKSR